MWHQAQIMSGARVGRHCTLGKGSFVGSGAVVGNQVKIGNYANLFGTEVEDEAFIGPQTCLMEDAGPRATTTDGRRKGPDDWARRPVTVRRGASVGAGALVLPGVTVGRWAMVSAGAVVHRDVPDHVIVAGNPARQTGFACACGARLPSELACSCGLRYRLVDDKLVEATA